MSKKTVAEIAAEAEALRAEAEGADVEVEEEEEGDDEGKEAKGKDKSPPGFKSYEEYIAEGGDPDLYKGKKAYEAEKKRIDEIKDLKKEFKVFTQQLMTANAETMNKERLAMKAQLEAELKQQKADGDVDGALETKEKLTELKAEVKAGPVPLHPVIEQFIEDNPILDKNSDEYDPKFFKTMARLQAKEINTLSGNGGADLDPDEMRRCTQRAYEAAQEYYPDLFKPEISPRNERAGQRRKPNGATGEGKGQSLEVRLKNLKITDRHHNPDVNANAHLDTYKFMKEKYGAKAADKFARSILED